MRHLPQLLSALSEPLLVEPAFGQRFLALIGRSMVHGETLSGEQLHAELGIPVQVRAATVVELNGSAERASEGPGIAVIPIVGVIAQRAQSLGASTDWVGRQLSRALADPKVEGILFDIDSPGGTITGVPELAERIRAASRVKPTVAVANGLAASAGYWLAAAATEVWVTPSGQGAGSIGVWTAHEDWSQWLEKQGIAFTEIAAGKFKTEGAFWKPLSLEGLEFLRARISEGYAWFTKSVATYRGDTLTNVRTGYGEGRVLPGQAAVAAKLADKVGTIDDAMDALAARITKKRTSRVSAETPDSGDVMKTTQTDTTTADPVAAPAADPAVPVATAEEPAAPGSAAAASAPSADQLATARTEGATAERTRILAIVDKVARTGDGAVVRACLEDPACSVEQAALRVIEAERGQASAVLSKLAGDEQKLTAPAAVPQPVADPASPQAVAARVLSLHEKLHSNRAAAQRTA